MTNTNHNYRRARKTETPCRWCIYGLMRAGAGRVQCLKWGMAAKKGHTCDAARAVMMKEVPHGAE
ncbi:hypothetical protein [Desulfovibrio piger]|uniref:hypothetical protein n=1 Tax=Desulfovibrio piger TaxID=901 RepID=UPI0026ED7615|nr:hypothetical protein [Desulfovibrio piger]